MVFFSTLIHATLSVPQQATVYFDSSSGAFSVKSGIDKAGGCAYGQFDDVQNSTGWGVVDIHTANAKDDIQYYCGGYLEGVLTAKRIKEAAINHNSYFGGQSTFPSKNLTNFARRQKEWTNEKIMANPADPFWIVAHFIVSQFEGLVAGARSVDSSLSEFDILTLQSVGDFFQIIPAVDKSARKDWYNMEREQFFAESRKYERCSALIKVTDDLGDLLWGHSSWFSYMAMNRMYKHYTFGVSFPVAAKSLSFSSYPGYLVSLDDFYIMDNGIAMIQTSNGVYDNALLDLIKPESLYAWQRVRISNTLASSGAAWYKYFSIAASGTYVNQYMILNFGSFEPFKPLKANTLWVIEEIPGLVYGGDVTENLERGYWPSYNVPYWPNIYNISGYPGAVDKYGPESSYALAPRAKIFRREHSKVQNIDGIKSLLRQNNYKTDPFSGGSPNKAICSRGDLANPASPGGCYDTKVTSLQAATKRTSWAVNGPTTSGGSLTPFQWGNKFSTTLHVGQPDVFKFDFVQMQPAAL